MLRLTDLGGEARDGRMEIILILRGQPTNKLGASPLSSSASHSAPACSTKHHLSQSSPSSTIEYYHRLGFKNRLMCADVTG